METKETEPKVTNVVGAVIFNNRRDSILVGQRAEGKKFPFKWEFIGGKAETGESLEQAVEREMDEEVGLDVEVVAEIDQAEHNYGGDVGIIRVHFIECHPKGNVVLKQFDRKIYNDIRWVKVTEAPKLDWIEADKEFAQNLAVSLTAPVPSRN